MGARRVFRNIFFFTAGALLLFTIVMIPILLSKGGEAVTQCFDFVNDWFLDCGTALGTETVAWFAFRKVFFWLLLITGVAGVGWFIAVVFGGDPEDRPMRPRRRTRGTGGSRDGGEVDPRHLDVPEE